MKTAIRLGIPGIGCLLICSGCLIGRGIEYRKETEFSLTDDRRVDWSRAGFPGGIPDVDSHAQLKLNPVDFGATPEEDSDDTQAIQAAIDSASAAAPEDGFAAVVLPAGIYRISQTLHMRAGVILAGSGDQATTIECDLSPEFLISAGGPTGHCISADAVRPRDSQYTPIAKGFAKGVPGAPEHRLWTEERLDLSPGDVVNIRQENDAERMFTSKLWDKPYVRKTVGQFAKVLSASSELDSGNGGYLVVLDRPLRYTYYNKSEIAKVSMLKNIGLQDFRLIRRVTERSVDPDTRKYIGQGDERDINDTHTIFISGVENFYIKRLWSTLTVRAHIWVQSSFAGEIREDVFHHSWAYGQTGHGYGVALATHVGDVLVEDNVFYHLRHAMMVKQGANGNVFSMNFSERPYGTAEGATIELASGGSRAAEAVNELKNLGANLEMLMVALRGFKGEDGAAQIDWGELGKDLAATASDKTTAAAISIDLNSVLLKHGINIAKIWVPADISLHGHYAFMNLFESNVAHFAFVADYWGPMGPGNTFFRNRFQGRARVFSGLIIQDASHKQNVIDNSFASAHAHATVNNVLTARPSNESLFVGNKWKTRAFGLREIAKRRIKYPPSLFRDGDVAPAFVGSHPYPNQGADLVGKKLGPDAAMLPAESRFLEICATLTDPSDGAGLNDRENDVIENPCEAYTNPDSL